MAFSSGQSQPQSYIVAVVTGSLISLCSGAAAVHTADAGLGDYWATSAHLFLAPLQSHKTTASGHC